jgi:hypothetical protein
MKQYEMQRDRSFSYSMIQVLTPNRMLNADAINCSML